MLSPIVPHITHVLWHELGHTVAVIDAPWPRADESALARDEVQVVVQVNGKLRGHATVAADAGKDVLEAAAFGIENVQRFIEGQTVRRVIVRARQARQHRRLKGV